MIVDCHAHLVPPELLAEIRKDAAKFPNVRLIEDGGSLALAFAGGKPTRPVSKPLSDIAGRVAGMARQGIDRDFGTSMRDIFDPASHATFAWERWTRLRNRRTHVFTYRIPLEFTRYTIEYQGESKDDVQRIKVGYHGSVFVDKELSTIVRITQEADNIPPTFPVREARETLDYDFTKIGDSEFFLPLVKS